MMVPDEAVEVAWLTITRLLASRNANPSSVYRTDVRAALEAATPADERKRVSAVLEAELRRQSVDEFYDVPRLARQLADVQLATGVFRDAAVPQPVDRTRHAIWRAVYDPASTPGLQPTDVADKATDAVLAVLFEDES